METTDRFEGCILGLAIGDALGAPTEFINTMDAIRRTFPPDGVRGFEEWSHPAGTYTDDTQMSLAVARALVEAGHRDLDDLMGGMAREFVAWSESPDNDRAPGNTCLAGCERLAAGV